MANLGERALGRISETNPLVDVTADDDTKSGTEKEIVIEEENTAAVETTLIEAVDGSDDAESSPLKLMFPQEALASEMLSTTKKDLEKVDEESLGDKPEGEDSITGLGRAR